MPTYSHLYSPPIKQRTKKTCFYCSCDSSRVWSPRFLVNSLGKPNLGEGGRIGDRETGEHKKRLLTEVYGRNIWRAYVGKQVNQFSPQVKLHSVDKVHNKTQ